MKAKEDTVKKVYSARDRIEADMIIEMLKSYGINAYKKGVGNSGIMDIYSGNSLNGEDIYVHEKDAQAAEELLVPDSEIQEEGWEEPESVKEDVQNDELQGNYTKPTVRILFGVVAVAVIIILILTGVHDFAGN